MSVASSGSADYNVSDLSLTAALSNGDPSNTTTLRERKYRPALTRRIDALISAVRETVAANDALGIEDLEPLPGQSNPSSAALAQEDFNPRDYFTGSPGQRFDAFITWFENQAEAGVLEATSDEQIRLGQHYTAKYIRSAVNKGENFAVAELQDQGIDVPAAEETDGVLPRATRTRLLTELYDRNYQQLQDVTEDMAEELRNELTMGKLRGETPRDIATEINGRIRGIGRWRAELIARTEVLYAHNRTAAEVYGEWFGPEAEVGIRPEGTRSSPDGPAGQSQKILEHVTAGDLRVCPECRALAGSTYTVTQVRNNPGDYMPPVSTHPQCRCVVVPTGSIAGS
jgi:hypothetical protein